MNRFVMPAALGALAVLTTTVGMAAAQPNGEPVGERFVAPPKTESWDAPVSYRAWQAWTGRSDPGRAEIQRELEQFDQQRRYQESERQRRLRETEEFIYDIQPHER